MNEKAIAETLLSQGVLGLVVLALGYVVARLWKQLNEEHNARITEAKQTTEQLLKVTDKVHETVTKLHELGEWAQNAKRPAE